ncbi:unnamed protein product [Paramecium primaurelia]|uniref:Dynein axonemal assembly factor 5 TPR repeats domain-containing protein n=1 Tax=Paramecium primaurelia TaxID=5886 RepID=A0A8S1PCS6_PARPR|nr:unnamed protein product [Paramecium primaurelia]
MSENPFEVFKEDMENEEVYLRVNAIHRVRIICTLIGIDQIKSQLIPYLDSLLNKDEDEVLFAMAEELGNIAEIIPNQSSCLLNLLEKLTTFDETLVREQAVKSISIICQFLSDLEIVNVIVPMWLRLAQNDTYFTCRISAINLMSPIYARAGTQKDIMRLQFFELCKEEALMVRRAVASKIGEIAQYMEKSHVIGELLQAVKELCHDEQDSVRLLCSESLMRITQILNYNEIKAFILPLIILQAEDKSWKVRMALAQIFADLAIAVGKDIADNQLLPICLNLLKDTQSDVRVMGVKSLLKFIKFISPEKLNLIVPNLQILSEDSFSQVKQNVCEVIGLIANLLPKEYCQNKLQKCLFDLMSDENTEVRRNAIKSVGIFVMAIGFEQLNQFIPYLKKSMYDPKWRVRKETIQTIIQLALQVKQLDTFTQQLEEAFLLFLRDRAAEVRSTGLSQLSELISVYKQEWALSNFLQKCVEILEKDNGCFFRINALYAIQQISFAVENYQVEQRLWPIVQKYLKDPIPNIRFVSLKVAKSLLKKIENQDVLIQIKQSINEMLDDPDRDVKFYVQEALQY